MKLTQLKESVAKKCTLLKSTNLNPELVKNLGDWLRMELTFTSNAIEGNTLTRQETKLILDEDISIGGKSIIEILEVKNHKRALEHIIALSQNKKTNQITSSDIFAIHSIILEGIDYINGGKYRNVPVRISGSLTILPNYAKVPVLMDRLLQFINDYDSPNSVLDVIDLAIKVHYDLITIHPFKDGNGRTARLIFNLILLQNKIPLSFIKKEERNSYLNSLEKAQTGGSDEDYKLLMYSCISRSVDLYLDQNNEQKTANKKYKIGEISKLSNEQIPTIRHWISIGLIRPYTLTQGGYAIFDDSVLATIKQIRFLQTEKRLTLEEIKQLIYSLPIV